MSNSKHFREMYILVRVIVLCLFGVHARGGARSEPSLWSLAENCARLTAKLKYFHGFLTFTDGEYTCKM